MLLFHNTGHRFENVRASAGPAFSQSLAGHGLTIGDFDNDGAVDALVSANGGAPLLLRNISTHGNHWLGVRLIGTKANPDAVGARIVWQAGDLKRSRLKVGGGSYLSSHDAREVLGIGSRKKIDRLEIHWPLSGRVDTFTELPIDRYITIVEGSWPPLARVTHTKCAQLPLTQTYLRRSGLAWSSLPVGFRQREFRSNRETARLTSHLQHRISKALTSKISLTILLANGNS